MTQWKNSSNSKTFASEFAKKKHNENDDKVGPDVWCNEAFDQYKKFLLVGHLRVVIKEGNPIFAGNLGPKSEEKKIIANKKGESLISFGRTKCDYQQAFAWLAKSSAIVGNYEQGNSVGRKFTAHNLSSWGNVTGVNLGELKSLLLDRIDRISINQEGIKDSRGNFVKWNPKYNPTFKINYL